MTAINFVVLAPSPSRPEGAVHFFCDGAAYNADAVLVSIAGKANILSSISACMVGSGRSISIAVIAQLLENRVDSFDDLRERVPDILPGILDHCDDLFGEDPKGVRLFFGGHSESRGRAIGFAIASMPGANAADGPLTQDAFTVMEQVSGQSPALSQQELCNGFGHMPTMADVDAIEQFAETMLELQRHHRGWPDGLCRVGGFAELVTVTRDRVESRILKRWPDKIGELIQPEPVTDWAQWRAVRAGAAVAGLSRLQRQMAERKQRKAQRAAR